MSELTTITTKLPTYLKLLLGQDDSIKLVYKKVSYCVITPTV